MIVCRKFEGDEDVQTLYDTWFPNRRNGLGEALSDDDEASGDEPPRLHEVGYAAGDDAGAGEGQWTLSSFWATYMNMLVASGDVSVGERTAPPTRGRRAEQAGNSGSDADEKSRYFNSRGIQSQVTDEKSH
jgi:hypothetical protein